MANESPSDTSARSNSPARSDPFEAVAHHFGFQGEINSLSTVRTFLRIKGVKPSLPEELTLVVLGGFFMRAGLSETARMILIGELADHDPRQIAVDVVAIFDGVFATTTCRSGAKSWDLRSGESIQDPIRNGHRQLMTSLFHVGNYHAIVRDVLGG